MSIIKKVIRNVWDIFHLVGPFLLFLGIMWLISLAKTPMEYLLVTLMMLEVLVLPMLWEIWDRYKVNWNDSQTESWPLLAKLIFTSEGRFDAHDMKLGYAGIGLALILGIFIF